MRSLFLKIFVWFWLLCATVAAVLALVVWLYPFDGRPVPGRMEELHQLQVTGALAVYETRGLDAFTKHMAELDRAVGFRTYFVDDQGDEIRGIDVPDFKAQTLPPDVLLPPGPHPENRGPWRGAGGRGSPGVMNFTLTDSTGKHWSVTSIGRMRGGYTQDYLESRTFLLQALGVTCAAGLGCYLLSRYLVSPLRRLQAASRRLGAGDLSARVGTLAQRRDEVGQLGRDLDQMADKLERMVNAQTRLLGDVSHELRSPLARLNVALELAGQDAPPASANALNRAGLEVERLNALIGRLLSLVRLEHQQGSSPRAPVQLERLMREVVADATFEAQSANRRLQIDRADPCQINGAPELLASAIENVVRNAVQYTAPGTTVRLSLSREPAGGSDDPVAVGSGSARGGSDRGSSDRGSSDRGGTSGGDTEHAERAGADAWAVLRVRDHGPGIPEESLTRVFEPFYRVSSARERGVGGTGGTGLGLAIAARAIRLHGGEIRAANAAGGGLEVTISFPLPASA